MKRSDYLVAAVLAAVTALSACSGDDAASTATAPPGTATAAGPNPGEASPAAATAPPPPALPAEPAAEVAVVVPAADVVAAAVPADPPAAGSASAPPPAGTSAPAATGGTGPAYGVDCPPGAAQAEQCQVDKDTYVGWRTYASQCQVCHGGSGIGTTFAPNLLDRLNQTVDHSRFVESVIDGYRGQVGAMPGWKGNPSVEPNIDHLYRYLRARADGALPPGRPATKAG